MALHGQRGCSLSQKRTPPFEPPEKGLHCGLLARRVARAAQWRCGVRGCATSLLRVVTDSNRALLRGARVTLPRRRTAVRAAALLRSPRSSDDEKTTALAVVFLFLQVIQSRADSGNNKCRKRTILAADHLFDFFKHIVGKAYRFIRRRRYARNLKGHSSHLQYNLYDKCIA